jgi:zinc protease
MAQMLNVNLANPDRYALQLANDVLGGNGFASRLMVDIRVKHGYAYGASSGLNIDRSRSMFYVYFGSDPDKVAPVDTLVGHDVRALQSTPIKAAELDNARQFQIRSIPLQVSSVGGIARSLLSWSWHGEPLDQPMIGAKYYLSLTAEQVQAACRQYLRPDHFTQVVQGPQPKKH